MLPRVDVVSARRHIVVIYHSTATLAGVSILSSITTCLVYFGSIAI